MLLWKEREYASSAIMEAPICEDKCRFTVLGSRGGCFLVPNSKARLGFTVNTVVIYPKKRVLEVGSACMNNLVTFELGTEMRALHL